SYALLKSKPLSAPLISITRPMATTMTAKVTTTTPMPKPLARAFAAQWERSTARLDEVAMGSKRGRLVPAPAGLPVEAAVAAVRVCFAGDRGDVQPPAGVRAVSRLW